MNYIDISWPITNEMTTYKNVDDVEYTQSFTYERDGYRKSILSLSTHTGTHIDAPSHFLENGKTIDKIRLETLIGVCNVIDLTHVEDKITHKDLKKIPIASGSRLLLKTKNSELDPTKDFDFDFVAIDLSAAEYLVECGIQAIGFDYLGIERGDSGHRVHKAFMNANITIIEGLRLASVDSGVYQLICLPLLMPGSDGVPARAILQSR